MAVWDCDVVVIGSGFGGSVSALRLCEAGQRVIMLEKGRALVAKDFPKRNWDLRRWLWMPRLGCFGLFQMRFFRHLTVLSGVGVGGGSLVYANTLQTPTRGFFESPSWSNLADWQEELAPHYETARRMLGAVPTPRLGRGDEHLHQIAKRRGHADRFHPTTTAVFFGEPGKTVPDPYFGGEGPDRTGCHFCGACMTGCRHGAKNTLDLNYLYFAKKAGLDLRAESEVTKIARDGAEGYEVHVRRGRFKKTQVIRSKRVILSAGVLGSVDLLLRCQSDPKGLPRLSACLGTQVRSNSEALIGVVDPTPKVNHSQGIAIASMYQCSDDAHMEVCRYGEGSGFFRILTGPHVPGHWPAPLRLIRAIRWMLMHPRRLLRTLIPADWAKSTMILLYMKACEGTLAFRQAPRWRRWLGTMVSQKGQGPLPQASLPEASSIAIEMAKDVDGMCLSMATESFFNIPTTAHVLGGCPMGEDATQGVIDHRHEVFGYPGLYVIDGSAISANLGVNPSLTITAMAERAMKIMLGEMESSHLELAADCSD